MASVYIQWPPKEPPTFPNQASLPIPYLDGALAITLDTYTLYVFDGQTQMWLAIGGTTVPLSVGTIDSQPKSANGAVIALNQLFMQTADATHPGLVETGNLTDVGTDGITIGNGTGAVVGSGTTISQHVSDTTHNGYLSSTDWNTFNGKQPAGNYISALTGDGSATGPGSVPFTLATVNSNVGSFGSSTSIPSFTVNAKGLITAASGNAVIAPAGTLTGTTLNSTVVSSSLTSLGSQAQALNMNSHLINNVTDPVSNQDAATKNYVDTHSGTGITALTGDVTASGPGSAVATLATVNSNVGSFTYSSITVNAKGLVTAASSGAAPVTTLAAVGASPNSNAAVISGNTLNLEPFDSTHPGVVTASGGGTTNFLRADGSWAAPTGSSGFGNLVVSAYIPGTANSNLSRSSTALGTFGTDVHVPAPTQEFAPGTPQIVANSQIYAFTVSNLPVGYYRVSIDVNLACSNTQYSFLAINDGTTTSGRWCQFNGVDNPGAHVEGYFHYTSPGTQTFELFGASSSAGTLTIQNDQSLQQVYFSLIQVG